MRLWQRSFFSVDGLRSPTGADYGCTAWASSDLACFSIQSSPIQVCLQSLLCSRSHVVGFVGSSLPCPTKVLAGAAALTSHVSLVVRSLQVRCYEFDSAWSIVWRKVFSLNPSVDLPCAASSPGLSCFGGAVALWQRAVVISGKTVIGASSLIAYLSVGYAAPGQWNCVAGCEIPDGTLATLSSNERSFGDALALYGTLLLVGSPAASDGMNAPMPLLARWRCAGFGACFGYLATSLGFVHGLWWNGAVMCRCVGGGNRGWGSGRSAGSGEHAGVSGAGGHVRTHGGVASCLQAAAAPR